MQKNFKLKTVLFPAACFCAAALIVGCANGSDSSSGLHLVSLPSGVTTQLPASSGNNPFLTTGIFYETSSDAANPDSANSIHFTSDSEAVYYSYGSQYEKVAYAYDTTSNKLYGKPVAFYDEDSSSWTSLEDYVEGWAEVAAYFGSPMTTEEKNELYTALQIVHSFDYTIAADVLTTTGIYLTGLPWYDQVDCDYSCPYDFSADYILDYNGSFDTSQLTITVGDNSTYDDVYDEICTVTESGNFFTATDDNNGQWTFSVTAFEDTPIDDIPSELSVTGTPPAYTSLNGSTFSLEHESVFDVL